VALLLLELHNYSHAYSVLLTEMDEESDTTETGNVISTEITLENKKSAESQDTTTTITEVHNLNPQSEDDIVDPLLNKPEDSEEDKIVNPLLSTDESPVITTTDDGDEDGGNLPTRYEHLHAKHHDDDDDDDDGSNSFEHLSPLSDDMQPSCKGFREVLGTAHNYV